MKVYLENSIFFFHKAHPPPAKGKRKATPPLFLPAPRPNPEWNGSPPRRLRPRPWERYSRPAIPATALPAAARTRTLRPAPPAACAPTRCSPHRACRRGERATCLPPFTPSHLRLAPRLHPATRAPPPARHIPLRFRGHIVFRRTKRYENKTKFCTGPCKMMNFTPSFWSS